MEQSRAKELVTKYNEGLADPSEVTELERLIEGGEIPLTELRHLAQLEQNIFQIPDPQPSMELDNKFYSMLAEESKKSGKSFPTISFAMVNDWFPKLALAATLLIAGFVGGYVVNKPSGNEDVSSLTQEVSDLKEMVMLSLLEKESATDRLRAVSLTSEMDNVSRKVTEALIQTLNQDGNVNVRLAALDALRPYVRDSGVREELIKSIASQNSPLVQVALADLMVELQEKKSVKELEKLLNDKGTPKEVKDRIQESIQTLI
ncbi:MAG: HEAT repeat domain-containing protein [Cyclobacteriaceae bacterium]|nr:HEAT repeat domain-containing protein [Cyclobacteriaceae bacterium]